MHNDFCELATELGTTTGALERWQADLELLAGDCLDQLQPAHRARALYYLTAYFASTAAPQVSSESLGDASISFAEQAKEMRGNPYGRMALQFAPCLAGIGNHKIYTARLLR